MANRAVVIPAFDQLMNPTLAALHALGPVFRLAAYRVADAPGSAGMFSWRDGCYFLERVPLSREAVFFNGAVSTLLAVLVVAGLAGW